jgi:hypothetical protein
MRPPCGVPVRPHKGLTGRVNDVHDCDSFAAGALATTGGVRKTNPRQAGAKSRALISAGYRDILHRGVLTAATGQEASSLTHGGSFPVEYRARLRELHASRQRRMVFDKVTSGYKK